ncbi:thiosulfohydrolase SoxB [Methylobacterium sp. WSM2598]|uniref:thiosulfohydrolase SoxB n=1 Tax=Methylobacterium sp. WSM2598 TaxID=398261 RepID=UPI00037D1FA3|nr:thiosulfohydrolase SoxB [Methylobacterium sp. WSM2598]
MTRDFDGSNAGLPRRRLLQAGAALALPFLWRRALAQDAGAGLYDLEPFGNGRLLHMTDTHAQLRPVLFREPSVNIGIGAMRGRPPHLVGEAFLKRFGIAPGSREAYAFTYLDFEEGARRYGRLGGFAHLKSLVARLRAEAPGGRAMLVDGGDLWQGSGLSNARKGADMVEAANLLGIEAMTGHWEFTYGQDGVRANLDRFKGEFLAQNVFLTEEAAFNEAPAFDSASGRVFKPATVKAFGDRRVAIIGQAFPYVPIAHPKRFTPDWTFGIRDAELQTLVDDLRTKEKVDAVVLLSHNGMDVDLKLASRVSGIDLILGGHTHDAVPEPVAVTNSRGKTLVSNAGSNGKFLAVVDLDLAPGSLRGIRYRLLPVFADLLKPDAEMEALITSLEAPNAAAFGRRLATAGDMLYRRGNFTGTMDHLLCDALRAQLDAQISLSPGFRWGTTTLAGGDITAADLLAQTATTYSEVYVQPMTGAQIHSIMEDVCDNLFNPDPYYQQGGDMVRVGGLSYRCEPGAESGKRLSNLTLTGGGPLDPAKTYKVAGWASVNPQEGKPVWEVLEAHLGRSGKATLSADKPVEVGGVADNPGYGKAA